MRIAVIGAFGQLGSDLVPLLGKRAVSLGHTDIEITKEASISSALEGLQLTHVINCAAYNLVDRAEDEPEMAFLVNALGPRNLARWCAANGTMLLHVSTDYVFGLDDGLAQKRCPESPPLETPISGPRTHFSGNTVEDEPYRPWNETDQAGPVSTYGASKLSGEYFVRSLCERHLIVRTCGLYGHRAARGKGNFVETMLRLGRERPELRIVADQRCTPTSTAELARALVNLIDANATGLFHATNTGDCTWFEFASEIFRLANLSVKAIPIAASDYAAKARRPDYSVLNTTKLADAIGSNMSPWQDALARYLADREQQ
jgi:dTDP-4-dehydrorhamnose reductase